MEILAFLSVLVFGFVIGWIIIFAVVFTLSYNGYINWRRILRFLKFLFLPHLYLHQMYNYVNKDTTQGWETDVQYVINEQTYTGHADNYYTAMWQASNNPQKEY